ncbi:DUF317 domain-containing protein [Kitasatospora sp. YST-16]|uniref:DUF317 domain-containing protein n=1 Tax=Kitasatospora sp. YST-16 TaxID=2998080 RepID=UPI0022835FFA|nr:DUF317 domain-containing protein [Kitasatospora sp. YST-16]WAL74590.1 DUF317 domain-containing protein [Kitasatospora sp. YST-16]WNW40648.1 DUF317 domain-containing protein [Streptomyces sp. Li-HN-5-13]
MEGWTTTAVRDTTRLVSESPCMGMRVVYDPERPEPWGVFAQRDLFEGINWYGSFSRNCPPEILHTFFADLADVLERDVVADTEAVFIGDGQPVADAFQVLAADGWKTTAAAHGTLRAASNDGLVLVTAGAHRSQEEESADGALRFVWSVAPGIPEVSWSARFSSDTPALVMAAFNRAVLYREPLIRFTSSLPPEVLARSQAEQDAAERPTECRPMMPKATELLAASPGLADSEVLVVPAHLAGPGDRGRAVSALSRANGWTTTSGATARFWDSPCATIRVAQLLRTDPEPSYRVRPSEGTWIITGAEEALAAPLWQMHLSPQTPAEVVGAVTSFLARASAEGYPSATRRALNAHSSLSSNLVEGGWSREEHGHTIRYTHPFLQVSYSRSLLSFSRHEELDHNSPSTHLLASRLDSRLTAWTLAGTTSTPHVLISAALEAATAPEPARRAQHTVPQQFLPFIRVLPPAAPRASAARSGTARTTGPESMPGAAANPTTPRRRTR